MYQLTYYVPNNNGGRRYTVVGDVSAISHILDLLVGQKMIYSFKVFHGDIDITLMSDLGVNFTAYLPYCINYKIDNGLVKEVYSQGVVQN